MRTVLLTLAAGDSTTDGAHGVSAGSTTSSDAPLFSTPTNDYYTPAPMLRDAPLQTEAQSNEGESAATFRWFELRAVPQETFSEQMHGDTAHELFASSLDDLADAFGVPPAEELVAATASEEVVSAMSEENVAARFLQEDRDATERPQIFESDEVLGSPKELEEGLGQQAKGEGQELTLDTRRDESDESGLQEQPAPAAVEVDRDEEVAPSAQDEPRTPFTGEAEAAAAAEHERTISESAVDEREASTDTPDGTPRLEAREPTEQERETGTQGEARTPALPAEPERADPALDSEGAPAAPAGSDVQEAREAERDGLEEALTEEIEDLEELDIEDLLDSVDQERDELEELEELEEELREQEQREAEDRDRQEQERDLEEELAALLDEVADLEAELAETFDERDGSPEHDSSGESDEHPQEPTEIVVGSTEAENDELVILDVDVDELAIDALVSDSGVEPLDVEVERPDDDSEAEASEELDGEASLDEADEGDADVEVDDERELEVEAEERDDFEPEDADVEEELEPLEVEGRHREDGDRHAEMDDEDYELPSDRFLISGRRFNAERAAATGLTEPHSYVLEIGNRLAPTSWEAKMDEHPFELRLNMDRSLTGEIRLPNAVETLWLGPDAIGGVRDAKISVRSLDGARLLEDFQGHVVMTRRR